MEEKGYTEESYETWRDAAAEDMGVADTGQPDMDGGHEPDPCGGRRGLVLGERESVQAGRCRAVCGEEPAGAGAAGRKTASAGRFRIGAVRYGNVKA